MTMEATLEKIDLMNLDKSKWKSFSFEEIAKRVSEGVDPATTTLEKYVGLEHIDPEDIHIQRFGSPSDVSGGKLKCYPGDVIFGKRRAYQRKAAIVHFEGICSAHAFVFRANPKVIDPKLFPFFLHSDQFMHRAVDISVGGLSPTINWGDLKGQEFLLPPKPEQARLAELLWAMDEVIEKEKMVLTQCLINKAVFSRNLLLGKDEFYKSKQSSPYGDIPSSWDLLNLFELRDKKDRFSFTGGPFGSDLKSKDYTESGVRVLQLQNIGDGEFLDNYTVFTSKEKADQLKSCNIFPNEIILAKMAPVARCCIIPETSERFVMCSDGIRLKVDEENFYNKFVYHAINSTHFRSFAESKSSGTTRGRIGLTDLKLIPIPIPKKDKQIEISNKLDSIDCVRDSIKKRILTSQSLLRSLINQIF